MEQSDQTNWRFLQGKENSEYARKAGMTRIPRMIQNTRKFKTIPTQLNSLTMEILLLHAENEAFYLDTTYHSCTLLQ